MSLAQIRDAVHRIEQSMHDRGEHDAHTHQLLHQVLENMSALSDAVAALTSAVADNTTATNNAVNTINTLPGAPSDAGDVAAGVTAVQDAATQVAANTAALNGAKPPAP